MREALNAIVRPPINVVRTWDGWKSELKDGPRSLLVIICHTAEKRSSSGRPKIARRLGPNRDTVKRRPRPVARTIGAEAVVVRLRFGGLNPPRLASSDG